MRLSVHACIALVVIGAQSCKIPFVGSKSSDDSAGTVAVAASYDPDGVYGISPRVFKVAFTPTANYPGFITFSADTGGNTRLQTDFSTGWVSGILPGITYDLLVYGVDKQGGLSPRPLTEYHAHAWPGFDKAPMALQTIDGARYSISWNYAPWNTFKAGNNILNATRVRCSLLPNGAVDGDPFTGEGSKVVEAPATDGKMLIDTFQQGIGTTTLIGCQMVFADKSVDTNPKRFVFNPTFHLKPCAITEGIQDRPYTCTPGFIDDAGKDVVYNNITFEMDPAQNTCSFIQPLDSFGQPAASGLVLSGTPNDNQVGTCVLAYRVHSTSGGVVSATPIHIANVQPRFVETGVHPRVLTEDLAVTTDGGYSLVLDDFDVEVDEEIAGRKVGIQFGTYSETRNGVATPCSLYGAVKIDAKTGRTLFKPDPDYYGVCNIGVQYDDGNASEGNNLAVKVYPVRVLARNDAPAITDGPGAGDPRTENCGDHCYVGAEYDYTLGTNQGGGKYVELDQNLSLVQCAPDAASAAYVRVTYCAFDPKSKQLELSFAPLAVPPAGVKPKISVQVQDDGYDETATGNYDANGVALVTRVPKPLKSEVFSFNVDIQRFTQTTRPAVVVSEAACISCHANINGDMFTDFGLGHAETVGHFWNNNNTNYNAMGDQAPAGYEDGFNVIDALSGNFYVPNKTLLQPFATVSSDRWTFRPGITNGFTTVATLAEFLSVPGRAQKLSGIWMPAGFSSPSQVTTIMNPAFVSKVKDTFVNSLGVTKPIKTLVIDWPTAADIQALDKHGLINWTSATAQFTYMGGDPAADNSALLSGLAVRNAAVSYVANNGNVRCIGDVLIKGSLVLTGATIETSSAAPCRIHVDGVVAIFGADGSAFGLNIVAAPGQTRGVVQITSDQAVLMGMGPTIMPDWDNWFGSTLTPVIKSLGITDAMDGCYGAPGNGCGSGAERTFQFERVLFNAPVILSRYKGQFSGAIIARDAAFRLSNLTYSYDPALANDIAFPRLRTLKTNARPTGLNVFDLILGP